MDNQGSVKTSLPLVTGIIGEAVLELIERSMKVNSENILAMLERKRNYSQAPLTKIIDEAMFWLSRSTPDNPS